MYVFFFKCHVGLAPLLLCHHSSCVVIMLLSAEERMDFKVLGLNKQQKRLINVILNPVLSFVDLQTS